MRNIVGKRLKIFAFGGNEVSPQGIADARGKTVNADIPMQWNKTAQTARLVADIIERNPDDLYLITHGNGPQVGNALLRAEYARSVLHSLPLDVCVASTQGTMAYMIAQFNSEFSARRLDKKVLGIVTHILVDKDDPDFKEQSKFIGPSYLKEEALKRKESEGWKVKLYKKDGKGREIWRRVVPSPQPLEILEIEGIEAVLKAGLVPITAGGGGIPVVAVSPWIKNNEESYLCNYGISFRRKYKEGETPAKIYRGVEAVIDKDLASALLGRMLIERALWRGEDLTAELFIFTGEDGAKLNYQQADEKSLRKLTLLQAQELYNTEPCPFPPGSMGPKIKAAIDFVKGGGSAAYITKTEFFEQTLKGGKGTTIVP
ncbi:MAG: hypothetical protein NTW04_02535 [Elusimicrobia bacterium]|nr:hypothetical protein [Elusimicrobiota bacterium]